MPDRTKDNEQTLHAEIARLNKIIRALMNRAERNTSLQGGDFNLFQTTVTLEEQVRRRTAELEEMRLEMEKITRALREKEHHHRLLIENAPVSIHEIDADGRVTSMSRAGLLMRGVKDESEVLGSLYLDAACPADRERIDKLFDKAFAGETCHFEFRAGGPHEKIYKSCFVPIKNKHGRTEKLMGITEDVTERKKAEEKIRKLAFYDTLTQLPNRRLLTDRLNQAMAAGKRSKLYGALIFLDLDNFKMLNDEHGHDKGDLLLIEAARRITCCLREMDTVARFGGDEFVIMLSELDADETMAREKAAIVAERIRSILAKPYQLTCTHKDGEKVTVRHHCTASIGVVLYLGQKDSQDDILKWADMAMYQAKADGRNTIRFFDRQGCLAGVQESAAL